MRTPVPFLLRINKDNDQTLHLRSLIIACVVLCPVSIFWTVSVAKQVADTRHYISQNVAQFEM